MKLLIIGGTVFLGRHLVEAALARGHEVTLFNRGQHNADLFPQVEKLQGNRDGNLDVLKGRRWDAVIDTCGYVPRIVSQSARLLSESVDHYTFISSISVYADTSVGNFDETAPVGTLEDETVEEIGGGNYGPLKALCERAVETALPGRSLIVRPGLIVGPHDSSDRFTYWPSRFARGGKVLAPGRPARQVQLIDARDLAEWNIRMVEAKQTGTFNATGPDRILTMGEVLETCQTVCNNDAQITWVAESFLLEQQVGPWMELPLWIPETTPGSMLQANIDRAVAAGLTFRPLADTVAATLEWDRTRPEGERRAGMKPDREAELLRAWHSQT